MDAPEAILRLLLGETGIQRLYAAPEGFNKDERGDWDEELHTFGPRRPIKLKEEQRRRDSLRVVYDFGELGWWELVIEPERVTIERI